MKSLLYRGKMKRQFQIIGFILLFAATSFLVSCSSATTSGGSMMVETGHTIDLKTDRVAWYQVYRQYYGGVPVPLDKQESFDSTCIQTFGRGSWGSAAKMNDEGGYCGAPRTITLEMGTRFCIVRFGDNYHAAAMTDRAILYCSEPTQEA